MNLVEFEGLEQKLTTIVTGNDWKEFSAACQNADDIWLIANGGLWSVASHQASDCFRLMNKQVNCFDNVSMLTSLANDFGYENIFLRYLKLNESAGKLSDKSVVIGMSGSGNSKNVVSALEYAESKGYKSFLFSGQKSKNLDASVKEICFDVSYFHTIEILCLMMFYQLIHESGVACPTIAGEVQRKGF